MILLCLFQSFDDAYLTEILFVRVAESVSSIKMIYHLGKCFGSKGVIVFWKSNLSTFF